MSSSLAMCHSLRYVVIYINRKAPHKPSYNLLVYWKLLNNIDLIISFQTILISYHNSLRNQDPENAIFDEYDLIGTDDSNIRQMCRHQTTWHRLRFLSWLTEANVYQKRTVSCIADATQAMARNWKREKMPHLICLWVHNFITGWFWKHSHLFIPAETTRETENAMRAFGRSSIKPQKISFAHSHYHRRARKFSA